MIIIGKCPLCLKDKPDGLPLEQYKSMADSNCLECKGNGIIEIDKEARIKRDNKMWDMLKDIDKEDVNEIMTLRVDDSWVLHRCVYCKGQGEEDIFALIGGWDENEHIADRSLFKVGSVIMVTDRHNVPLGNFEIIRDESPTHTSSGRLCFTFVARRKS